MKLTWDKTGERIYETGVDRGVLYPMENGAYTAGVAWNGLTAVTESPSGAEPTKLYANNGVYVTLLSAEEYGLTIEAYTYPDEFKKCDGSEEITEGVTIGQQTRSHFGFAYRSLIGNDEKGTDFGYKLHLVYNCLASPAEFAHNTVNDSPEDSPFSWEISTTPIEVEGYKATSVLTIDSTKVDKTKLASLETKLYGSDSVEPTLPLPAEVLTLLKA